MQLITITGRLEVRCARGESWRVEYPEAAALEIPYHLVLRGRVVIEDTGTETSRDVVNDDMLLMGRGSAHVLHGGGHDEDGQLCEHIDLLCGRFCIAPPHDRLIRDCLPAHLAVRIMDSEHADYITASSRQLANLVALMRIESSGKEPGRRAILNALSSALFVQVLRIASESQQAPTGLLALAGHPRLAPAVSAMFAERWE